MFAMNVHWKPQNLSDSKLLFLHRSKNFSDNSVFQKKISGWRQFFFCKKIFGADWLEFANLHLNQKVIASKIFLSEKWNFRNWMKTEMKRGWHSTEEAFLLPTWLSGFDSQQLMTKWRNTMRSNPKRSKWDRFLQLFRKRQQQDDRIFHSQWNHKLMENKTRSTNYKSSLT